MINEVLEWRNKCEDYDLSFGKRKTVKKLSIILYS